MKTNREMMLLQKKFYLKIKKINVTSCAWVWNCNPSYLRSCGKRITSSRLALTAEEFKASLDQLGRLYLKGEKVEDS